MSGYSGLPARPVEASPIRSPERPPAGERHSRGGYDAPPPRDYERDRGYDGDQRHYEGSREYDDRWGDDYGALRAWCLCTQLTV